MSNRLKIKRQNAEGEDTSILSKYWRVRKVSKYVPENWGGGGVNRGNKGGYWGGGDHAARYVYREKYVIHV